MKNGATFKENVEWLLNQYKLELEDEKNNENSNDFSIINREQMIWDFENIIMELEMILKISK